MSWCSSAAPSSGMSLFSSRRPLLVLQVSVTCGPTSTEFLVRLRSAASFHQREEGGFPDTHYSMGLMAHSVRWMLCLLGGLATNPLLLCSLMLAAFPSVFRDASVVWALPDNVGACLKHLWTVLCRWRGVLLESKCMLVVPVRSPLHQTKLLLLLPIALPGDAVLGLLSDDTPK